MLDFVTVVVIRSTVTAVNGGGHAIGAAAITTHDSINNAGIEVSHCKFWARDSTITATGPNSADSVGAMAIAKTSSVTAVVSYCEFVAKNTTVKATSGSNADSVSAIGIVLSNTGSQAISHVTFLVVDCTVESKTSNSDSETMGSLGIASQGATAALTNITLYAVSSTLRTICDPGCKGVATAGIAQDEGGTLSTAGVSVIAVSSTMDHCSTHGSSVKNGVEGTSITGSPSTPCCDSVGGDSCVAGTTSSCMATYPQPSVAGLAFITVVDTPTMHHTPSRTPVIITPTLSKLATESLPRQTYTHSTVTLTGMPRSITPSTRTPSVDRATATRSTRTATRDFATATRSTVTSTPQRPPTSTPSTRTLSLKFATGTLSTLSRTPQRHPTRTCTTRTATLQVISPTLSTVTHTPEIPPTPATRSTLTQTLSGTGPASASPEVTRTVTSFIERRETPTRSLAASLTANLAPSVTPAVPKTSHETASLAFPPQRPTPTATHRQTNPPPPPPTAMAVTPTFTLPLPVPRVTPKPAIPKEVVTEAESAGSGVASVGSAVAMGNPAVAAQGSRLAQLRAALSCGEKGDDDSIDVPGRQDNLLGLSIGDAPDEGVRGHVGAVLGNLVVLITVATLVGGVLSGVRHVYTKQRDGTADRSFQRSLAFCRFPGVMLFPTMFLLQPIATSSVVILGRSNGDAASIVLAVMGLLTSALCVVGAGVLVMRWVLPRFVCVPWVPATKGAEDASDTSLTGHSTNGDGNEPDIAAANRRRGMLFWFVSPQDEWVPTMAAKDATAASCLMRQFDLVLEPYRRGRASFVVIELLVSAVGGVVGGLLEVMQCMPPAVMAFCLYLLFCLAMIIMRPYTRPADFALQLTAAVLQLLASLCAVIWQSSHNEDVQAAGNFFVVVAAAIAVVLGVYELVKSVYLQATSDRKRRFAKAVSHAIAQQQSKANIGVTGGSDLQDLLLVDAADRKPSPPPAAEPSPRRDDVDDSLDELLADDDVDIAAAETARLEREEYEQQLLRERQKHEAGMQERRRATDHVNRIAAELEGRHVVSGARPLIDIDASFATAATIAFNVDSDDGNGAGVDEYEPPSIPAKAAPPRTTAPETLRNLKRVTSTVVSSSARSQTVGGPSPDDQDLLRGLLDDDDLGGPTVFPAPHDGGSGDGLQAESSLPVMPCSNINNTILPEDYEIL